MPKREQYFLECKALTKINYVEFHNENLNNFFKSMITPVI